MIVAKNLCYSNLFVILKHVFIVMVDNFMPSPLVKKSSSLPMIDEAEGLV